MFLYLKITLGYQKYLNEPSVYFKGRRFQSLVNYIICNYGCLN